MAPHRVAVFAFLFLALVGCSGELDKARSENVQLRTENRQLRELATELEKSNNDLSSKTAAEYVKQTLEEARMQRAASVTAACRVVFNPCPESVTAPGDAAIAQGVSGGGSWIFWTVLLLKILIVFITPVFLLLELLRRYAPTLKALKTATEATTAAQEAQMQLKAAQDAVTACKAALRDLEQRRESMQAEIAALEAKVAAKTAEFAKLDAERARHASVSNALDSFKF